MSSQLSDRVAKAIAVYIRMKKAEDQQDFIEAGKLSDQLIDTTRHFTNDELQLYYEKTQEICEQYLILRELKLQKTNERITDFG